MKNKVFVKVFNSKKSGKKCFALMIDLGYCQRTLSWDTYLIAEVLRVPVCAISDMDIGEYPVE